MIAVNILLRLIQICCLMILYCFHCTVLKNIFIFILRCVQKSVYSHVLIIHQIQILQFDKAWYFVGFTKILVLSLLCNCDLKSAMDSRGKYLFKSLAPQIVVWRFLNSTYNYKIGVYITYNSLRLFSEDRHDFTGPV